MTQANWYYESDGEGSPTQHRDKYVVASQGAGRVCTLNTPHAATQAEVIANGRLIAAAPELLVACEKLLFNALHGNGLEAHYEAQEKARKAIAKAKGAPTYD